MSAAAEWTTWPPHSRVKVEAARDAAVASGKVHCNACFDNVIEAIKSIEKADLRVDLVGAMDWHDEYVDDARYEERAGEDL